jgi:hypothetical protein
MQAELRNRWIAALRSGRYAQGKGYLRQDDMDGVARYCCLGVLCEVAGIEWVTPGNVTTDDDDYGYMGATEWAPSFLGLPQPDDVDSGKMTDQSLLANMNDTNASFTEIADWIEANISVEREVDPGMTQGA